MNMAVGLVIPTGHILVALPLKKYLLPKSKHFTGLLQDSMTGFPIKSSPSESCCFVVLSRKINRFSHGLTAPFKQHSPQNLFCRSLEG